MEKKLNIKQKVDILRLKLEGDKFTSQAKASYEEARKLEEEYFLETQDLPEFEIFIRPEIYIQAGEEKMIDLHFFEKFKKSFPYGKIIFGDSEKKYHLSKIEGCTGDQIIRDFHITGESTCDSMFATALYYSIHLNKYSDTKIVLGFSKKENEKDLNLYMIYLSIENKKCQLSYCNLWETIEGNITVLC